MTTCTHVSRGTADASSSGAAAAGVDRPVEPEHDPRRLRRLGQRQLQAAASSSSRSPDNPVTWPLFDDNPMIASGPRARERNRCASTTGTATSGRRSRRTSRRSTASRSRRRSSRRWTRRSRRSRPARSTSTSSSRRPDRIGRLVVGKALQPLNRDYLPNLDERLAVGPGPVVRQGLAVHGPVHDLDDGDRLPHGQGRDDARRRCRTRTRSTGTRRIEGKIYLLDDSRDAPAHMLLKNGITERQHRGPRATSSSRRTS